MFVNEHIWKTHLFFHCQTVKRPRRIHSMTQPPSPSGDSRVYTPSNHYYDADNDNAWYRNEGRDHASENKVYLEPDYRVVRESNQRARSRGRSQERTSPSPDRSKREGSRGRALDASAEHQRYHSRGRSPGEDYHTEDKYERGEGGGGGKGKEKEKEKEGRYKSRDQLNDNPPSPEPTRELEPLEKPVNVLLVKNRPSEGKTPQLR